VYDQVARNKRRSILLIGGFVLLVVAVALALDLLLGAGVPLVLAALVLAAVSAGLS
jgi:hypothetical protein